MCTKLCRMRGVKNNHAQDREDNCTWVNHTRVKTENLPTFVTVVSSVNLNVIWCPMFRIKFGLAGGALLAFQKPSALSGSIRNQSLSFRCLRPRQVIPLVLNTKYSLPLRYPVLSSLPSPRTVLPSYTYCPWHQSKHASPWIGDELQRRSHRVRGFFMTTDVLPARAVARALFHPP